MSRLEAARAAVAYWVQRGQPLLTPFVPQRREPGHVISRHMPCPRCGNTDKLEVRRYDEAWRDGEVWCARCDVYVRGYDAG
jgi:hypothetical protein